MKRVSSKKISTAIWHIIVYLILGVISFAALWPLLGMISTSLKTPREIFKIPPSFIPQFPQWRNYKDALTFLPFALYFRNTITIVIFCLIGHVFASSFVAYGFAKLHFPGRNILFMILISTMIVPEVVYLVPLFLLYRRLGWINTFLPLTVPAFLGYPYFIFLLRQFFSNVPNELIDAARIDGCSELGCWWRIILPLSRPALSVVAIYSFVGRWNDFFGPLIYLTDEKKRTLALGLYSFRGLANVEWHWLMAASVTITIPVIIVFFIFQKQFVEQLTLTGLKG